MKPKAAFFRVHNRIISEEDRDDDKIVCVCVRVYVYLLGDRIPIFVLHLKFTVIVEACFRFMLCFFYYVGFKVAIQEKKKGLIFIGNMSNCMVHLFQFCKISK